MDSSWVENHTQKDLLLPIHKIPAKVSGVRGKQRRTHAHTTALLFQLGKGGDGEEDIHYESSCML